MIQNSTITHTYDKQKLPNYAVFDEKRYFSAGSKTLVFDSHGIKIGLLICEDTWSSGPARQAKKAGAEILLSINASPYELGKLNKRQEIVKKRVSETALPLIYAASIGGQDELVFDGASFVMNHQQQIIASLPQFKESISVVELTQTNSGLTLHSDTHPHQLPEYAELYQALVLATRDYINKNKFPGAILGLSGGIDSALTLAITADAIGSDKVRAILMPSRYTADMSNEDAISEAKALNVAYEIIPIEPLFESYTQSLAPLFKGMPADLTEENLQARCRGTLLMALSNKFGSLVLTTSNKSESAVGYSTLYGDMAGGFNPLKDIYKTQVYELAKYRNSIAPVIPDRVITRPPSAELRANQTDQDSLPDYPTLDAILKAHIEHNLSETEITKLGFSAEMVKKVLTLIKRSEYKRQQAPIGPKISVRAFGKDWRMPITSGY